MTRKATRRKVIKPLPPRGLRPRLAPSQVADLSICHNTNLDAVARGTSDPDMLWHIAGSVLTWSRVAELLQTGMPEITPQLHMTARLIERYGRTGVIAFTGEDYQLAKTGVMVMDLLAEIVDWPTALAAAEWSEQMLQRIRNSQDIDAEANRVLAGRLEKLNPINKEPACAP